MHLLAKRVSVSRQPEACADELVAAYQRVAQGAFREVADALIARQRYAEQIDAQTRAVVVQRHLAQTARRRYDNGIAIYLEVADAERNLFAAEQQLLALQRRTAKRRLARRRARWRPDRDLPCRCPSSKLD